MNATFNLRSGIVYLACKVYPFVNKFFQNKKLDNGQVLSFSFGFKIYLAFVFWK